MESMPRRARVVIPGVYHHATQRGNDRQDVFFTDDDRQAYLAQLGRQCRKHRLQVHGYCLMTNHVHLIVIPEELTSLANALGRAHWQYAQIINELHGRSGHLWTGRFYSFPLDRPHFIRAMRYVERNPVRAGIVKRAWEYPWSSAPAHLGEPDASGLLRLAEWEEARADLDWRDVLTEPMDERELKRYRRHLSTGRPLGSDRFIAKLETVLGRRLRPLRPGRPRKPGKQARK